jgi:hypothetical protein
MRCGCINKPFLLKFQQELLVGTSLFEQPPDMLRSVLT